MHRRQFLGVSAAVTGILLGGEAVSLAERNLGFGAGETDETIAVPPRARDVTGRVGTVEGDTVSVELRPRESHETGRILLIRREYPAGDILARAVSDRVRIDSPTTVEVTVPRDGREAGIWFYESYLRSTASESSTDAAFLCESDPHRWAGGAGRRVTAGERLADAPTSVRRDRFARERDGNDLVLQYEWRDSELERWSLAYRLRRSLYEAALNRERGYVRTFEGSLSSPLARDLASAIASDATRESDGAVAGDLSRGEWFELLVRFVQDVRYARDFESMDVYEYNRTVEETLVDGVGDCKDKSYLLAGLLSVPPLECDVALCVQPAHVLIAVAASDVPDRIRDVEPIELGGREYVAIDASFRYDIGDYPNAQITAAYGSDEWLHFDPGAFGRGLERNVRDYAENSGRMQQ